MPNKGDYAIRPSIPTMAAAAARRDTLLISITRFAALSRKGLSASPMPERETSTQTSSRRS